ncbi:MAG: amidohydrolase [Deltaproteobacteria bacterium]|nr:amidohydrolase [Deltaproteobacteria bacterium]
MNKLFAAEKILINGKIVTVDSRDSIVEAVAIKDGRFLATGTTDQIKAFAANDTEVLDLEGKMAMPGIIDSHTHPMLQASQLLAINFRQLNVKTIDEVKELVKSRAQELGPGKWVRGVSFNEFRLEENRHITRWELDEVAPDNPVHILSDTYHQCIVNSQALKLAGVTKDTQDPPGGEIQRNEVGEATGLLYEMAEMLVSKTIPPYTVEEIKAGYVDMINQFSSWGVTSIQDAGAHNLGIRAFQQLLKEGMRQIRISLMVSLFPRRAEKQDINLLDNLVNMGIESGFGDDWHKVIAVKIMGDGSGVGGTAVVYEPQHRGPKGLGIWMTDPTVIEEMTLKAHEAGIRVSVHCIGDRAIDVVLDCIEKAQKKKPIPDMRHLLQHITCCNPKILERIKQLEVVPALTTGAIYRLGDQVAENFGPERSRWIYPHKTLKEMGVVAGSNSDFPIVSTKPFEQMYAVVTRKTANGTQIAPEEAVDIMDAIRIYTWNNAYTAKDEDKLGSIEPGKLADLIVIDRDITALPSEALLEANVLMTVVDGKTVYEA